MSQVQFEDQAIEALNGSISRASESQIDATLDLMVDEIF